MGFEGTLRAVPDPSRTDVVAPAEPLAGAVLLHPHPAYGGDRHNVVVAALWAALPPAGIAGVRFDFRTASVEEGAAEARRALDLLPEGVPLAIVGYSFGAIAASHCLDDRLAGWVLIAPPFGTTMPAASAPIGEDPRPKLLLTPMYDQFCPPDVAATEVAGWQSTAVEEIASSDHYLAGSTVLVGERVVRCLRELAGR